MLIFHKRKYPGLTISVFRPNMAWVDNKSMYFPMIPQNGIMYDTSLHKANWDFQLPLFFQKAQLSILLLGWIWGKPST